jgi:hypothetical protein
MAKKNVRQLHELRPHPQQAEIFGDLPPNKLSPTSAVGTILSDFPLLFRRNSLFIGPTRPQMPM